MHLGPHIDIQIFMAFKNSTDIQSFPQETMIYITTQRNFLKFRNIRKIMTCLSIL